MSVPKKFDTTPTPNDIVMKVNAIIEDMYPIADTDTAGISKLYDEYGDNEDGAMSQKAGTEAISTILAQSAGSYDANFSASFRYLGGNTEAISGVANTSPGFICAGGSAKGSSMSIKVNGTTLGYVVGRDYGSGTITSCVPVPKGASFTITGRCDWAYFVLCQGITAR